MREENQHFDKKSLRLITGKTADWDELAKNCVCFANARGGKLWIGVEDKHDAPPPDQRVSDELLESVRRTVPQRTVNVTFEVQRHTHSNGGEYLVLTVVSNPFSIASTTDGKYYIRVSDACRPLLPDDLFRLMSDRPAFNWELQTSLTIPAAEADPVQVAALVQDLRSAPVGRVSELTRQKSPEELLRLYNLMQNESLTNLGVLWIGTREQRARLVNAPVIQAIKYDERGQKINKWVWDDYSLNPKQLIEAVWREIPDWKEGVEVSDGMYRHIVPNYDEVVVRELLANAIVHRPYTTAGYIFLNLHPDRLEIVNPGRLPIGVTPENILHETVQRNPHFSILFRALGLMEAQGSGYRRMYARLLLTAKRPPVVIETDNCVSVTVSRRILSEAALRFMSSVARENLLTVKELIALGLIAQSSALKAQEICDQLGVRDSDTLQRYWIGRLIEWGLVQKRGQKKGTVYYVAPEMLVRHDFSGLTSLRNPSEERLRGLILETIERFGERSLTEVQQNLGEDISEYLIRKELKKLLEQGRIEAVGASPRRRYRIATDSANK